MASTYVNDLRLNEMATGDASGTWGEVTNTNLELIAEAFSYGTEAITTNANTHTTTIADGATDPGRSMYLKYTGTLDSACTITIGPNTVSKLWFIENATSGSQNIIISQGSGANITIPPGDVKVVYSDGAGSGAAVVDAFASLSVVDLKVQDDLTVTDDLIVNGDIDLEGNMDVNGSLETDALSLNGTTVTSTAAEINLLDGSSANTVVNSKAVIYGSSGQVAGTLSTAAQTNITSVGALNGGSITSGFGSIDVGSSAITTTGTVTGNTLAGTLSTAAQPNITSLGTLSTLTVDDITINGSTISDAGDLTVDVGGDIILNADGGDIFLEDAGTRFGYISNSSTDLFIGVNQSDKDIYFKGNDGGSGITALRLDMSEAGTAHFNHDIRLGDSGQAIFGAGSDLSIYHDNSAGNIVNNTGVLNITNNDIRFKTSGAETMLRAIANGAVKLMYNNSTKIETIDTGVTVTGAIGIGTTPTFGSGSGLEIERSGTCTIRLEDTSNKAAEIRQSNDFEIVSMNSGSDIVLDATGDIILDADGGNISFKDAGTEIGRFTNNSTNFQIYSAVQDVDIQFKGNDGGSTVTALTLDMSAAGKAIFNSGAAFSGNVDFADNAKAIFGAGSDLEIYHDGSNSYVSDVGTGGLKLTGGDIYIRNSSDADMIHATSGGHVKLYFNASEKLATTSNGINVTGTVALDDTLSIDSSTTNGFIQASSNIFQIGTSSNDTVSFYANNTEHMKLKPDGEVILNETGNAEGDFRVETASYTHGFFVNAGNSRVGINDSSPDRELEVRGDDASTSHTVGIKVKNTNLGTGSIAGIVFENYDNNGAYIRSLRSGGTSGILTFGINDGGSIAESSISEKLRISNFLVEPESGVNIGSIRNNGVTVSTSAVNVLNLGSVNSSGDKGKGRYLVTVCATSGTVGTAGSAIYGLSSSGAVYLYETVNANSVTFGSSGANVTASLSGGSYTMHVNAIPLSVDN